MRLKNLYGEQVYYFFSDHLGSTNVMTDSNGNVMSETLYKAWGEIRYSSGSSPTDFTYTGQRSELEDIGLMFYNARWYDPELARFTQADTIVPGAGNPAAYDRYAYVVNNPIGFSDPSGRTPCSDDPLLPCMLMPGERAPAQSYLHQEKRMLQYLDPFTRSNGNPLMFLDYYSQKDLEKYFVANMGLPTVGGNVTTKFGAKNTVGGECESLPGSAYDSCGIHAGVDISSPESKDLLAVWDGVIVFSLESNVNGGYKIVIRHSFGNRNLYSVYFHVEDPLTVHVGQIVSKGETIGLMGKTGADSVHLHFEARTQAGMGPQPETGFNFPFSHDYFWAKGRDSLQTFWVDISSRFGGYDPYLPEDWK